MTTEMADDVVAKRRKRRRTRKEGRYHHGNLRRALLDAALMMVEKEGPRGVSLRAVARLAGVSPAAPYRHFVGKEGLLAAVAEEGFHALADGMTTASAANKDLPLAEFRAIALAYVKFAAVRPSHFRVMFGPEVANHKKYPGLQESMERIFTILTKVISDSQRRGLEGAAEPRQLAMAAWATLHGLATLIVDGQLGDATSSESELQAVTFRIADVVYRGLSFSGL